MGDPRLRPATAADLGTLVHHRRRMWEDMGTLAAGAPDPSEAAYRAWLAPRLSSGEVVGWVADAGGSPVASGLLWFQQWHPRPTVPRGVIPYLLSVFVEPPARGQGLARAIAQQAIARTRAAGHPRLALHASEAGRPVYDSLGFRASPEMWLDVAAGPEEPRASRN
jgi:GNAT superfamily N-acetyltransferase